MNLMFTWGTAERALPFTYNNVTGAHIPFQRVYQLYPLNAQITAPGTFLWICASVDCLITLALCLSLRTHVTGYSASSDSVLLRIMKLSMRTAACTASKLPSRPYEDHTEIALSFSVRCSRSSGSRRLPSEQDSLRERRLCLYLWVPSPKNDEQGLSGTDDPAAPLGSLYALSLISTLSERIPHDLAHDVTGYTHRVAGEFTSPGYDLTKAISRGHGPMTINVYTEQCTDYDVADSALPMALGKARMASMRTEEVYRTDTPGSPASLV